MGKAKSFARSLIERPQSNHAEALRAMLPSPPWCVDFAEESGDSLEIRGWAVPPPGKKGVIQANGREIAAAAYGQPRDDIANIFWYIEGSRASGFACKVPLAQLAGDRKVVLSFSDAKTGQPFNADNNCFYKLSDDPSSFPSPERRKRVHGGSELSAFKLEGYATWTKLELALQKLFGRSFTDFHSILDWGCGCGRVGRHFIGRPSLRGYTGADIDSDNVAWCNDNLRRGGLATAKFVTLPLHPPTPLPSAGFDLLFGISVFTHLKEKEQLEWLAELERVSAKGAVLMMTVLSDASVCRSHLRLDLFTSLKSKGFLDAGANPDLDGAIADSDYYKNVFHTHEYISRTWSRFFDVRGVIPGYIGNHQDLVVMVRR